MNVNYFSGIYNCRSSVNLSFAPDYEGKYLTFKLHEWIDKYEEIIKIIDMLTQK
jgi:hypothetical protein